VSSGKKFGAANGMETQQENVTYVLTLICIQEMNIKSSFGAIN
jgi:hypothetical protein